MTHVILFSETYGPTYKKLVEYIKTLLFFWQY